MANHMAEVAKMLGVELGEEFKIIDNKTSKEISYNYYFSDKGLMVTNNECSSVGEYVLMHLIYGYYSIKRKPWKPQYEEKYWYVCPDGEVDSSYWVNTAGGNSKYKLGNCYRTKEAAEANRDKWVAFYESDEVLEV